MAKSEEDKISLSREALRPEKGITLDKQYYIRSAVDAMRASTRLGKYPESTLTKQLSYYTQSIEDIFSKKDEFASANEVRRLIFKMVKTINAGEDLKAKYHGLPKSHVERGLNHFAEEMLNRLNHPENFDPVETLALIEYRLRYARPFYPGADRRISEGLGALVMMRQGLRLPEYAAPEKLVIAGRNLPPVPSADKPETLTTDTLTNSINELGRSFAELKEDSRFQNWVEAFREQFQKSRQRKTEKFIAPTDPWQVQESNAADYRSTTYDRHNVTRSHAEIDLLRRATGLGAHEVVVYRPERMALQETIAVAVTQIKMVDPTEFLKREVLGKGKIFEKEILPQTKALHKMFERDRKAVEKYVGNVIDDHFHMQNPNMEIREIIQRYKELIENQIAKGLYKPKLIESRDVLCKLVADEVLRREYQARVRIIVDEAIKLYFGKNPKSALQLKENRERVAWVMAGGPAAGKSTLEEEIMQEHKILMGEDSPLCQINTDHYKTFLLPKDLNDAEHGSKTRAEGLQIRELILQRLEKMIAAEKTPDFLMATQAPTEERMRIPRQGGARVNLYMISCPAEVAVQRAFDRAKDETNEDAFNRFLATRAVLNGHRNASLELAKALKRERHNMRLYDTTSSPILTASIDSYNRQVKVHAPKAFVGFVRKGFLNVEAKSEEELYRGVTIRQIAQAICGYPKEGVNLDFRYSEQQRNIMLPQLHEMVEHERAVKRQPESYMWMGTDRASIRDFATFVDAFGEDMAIALMAEIAKKWRLRIRTYAGESLFAIDERGNILYNNADKLKDEKLQRVIKEAAQIIREERIYDQERAYRRAFEASTEGAERNDDTGTSAGRPSLPSNERRIEERGDRGDKREVGGHRKTQDDAGMGQTEQKKVSSGYSSRNDEESIAGEHSERSISNGTRMEYSGSQQPNEACNPPEERPPETLEKPSESHADKIKKRRRNRGNKGDDLTPP